jgi:ribosomal protein S27E
MVDPVSWKRMRLRYAAECRRCGVSIAQGESAVYDKSARNVLCLACGDVFSADDAGKPLNVVTQAAGDGTAAPNAAARYVIRDPPAAPVDPGHAGASARREFERRAAKREQRIRHQHPKLGGLILALTDNPQSTTAWRTGAAGEEALGRLLDSLADRGVRALHDRRIPRSRANIDHIAISPAGVFVIDAKRYRGRPSLRVEGGILRPRVETLMVGGRRSNNLIDGMHRQLGVVQSVIGLEIPITGMLVFVGADWPLIGGAFVTQRVQVLWPNKAAEAITQPGPLDARRVDQLHRALAHTLKPA